MDFIDGIDFIDGMDFIDGVGANMRPKGTGRTKRRKKSVQKEKPKRPPLSYYRWGGHILSETN